MPAQEALEIGLVEIRTRDLQRAREYYEAVFGWTGTPVGDGSYAFLDTGKQPIAALYEIGNRDIPVGVTPYLLAPEIDDVLADVAKVGGEVLAPKSEWGAMGFWANTQDPWGNGVALLQPRSAWSPSYRAAPRHPIVWAELRAPDLQAAVRYYKRVAGWSFQVKPGVDHFAFRSAGSHPVGVGLVGGARADLLGQLTMYARVDDLTEVGERVGRAGGSLSQHSKTAPETGRIRIAYDPDGNAMGLFEDGPRGA
ncbi:MAG: VOC family protein [Myxococcales bacterium]|nr:VOC family protein [Myxococcales bacterium]MCB9731943.1 VOC family protein [Deltaproteobacteria bacterium]